MGEETVKIAKRNAEVLHGRNWSLFQPSRQRAALLRQLRHDLQHGTLMHRDQETITTGRANHGLLVLEHHKHSYILKLFSIGKSLRWNRKLELTLKETFAPGAKRSYQGAVYLWNSGIPTARPLGYISEGPWPWQRVSVFVSEKIDADGNIQDIIATEKKLSRLRKKCLRSWQQ